MSLKIAYPLFELAIDLIETKVNVIVIENSAELEKFIFQLLCASNSEENIICLSENNEEINFSKNAVLILNPFDIDCNNKTITNKLYSEINEIAKSDEYYEKIKKVNDSIFELILSLTSSFDGPIEFSQEVEINSLLKSFNVGFDLKLSEKIADKIVNFMTIYTEFVGTKVFFIYNLKSILSESDLNEVYSYCFQKKILIVLIESFDKSKLDNEQKIIIDNDLCEIR